MAEQAADVAVVGAGMWGAFLAHHLAERGVSAVVVEAAEHPASGTTAAGLGTICRFWPDTPHSVLASRSNEMVSDLTERMGVERAPLGCLHVPLDEHGQRVLDESFAVATRRGVTIDRLGTEAVRRVAPLLAPDVHPAGGAAFLEREAFSVDTVRLTNLLLADVEAAGIPVWLGAHVRGFDESGHDVVLSTDRGQVRCERVVLAAGAWTRALGELAGVALAAIGLGHCRWETGPLVESRAAQPAQCFHHEGFAETYLRTDGERLLIGAEPADPRHYVRQPCADTHLVVDDYEQWLREVIAQRMSAYLPVLARTDLVSTRAGAPTHTPDGLPLAGPCAEDERIWAFTGCGGAGLMIGPPIAEHLADRLMGTATGPLVDGVDLSPGRFPDTPDDELFASVRAHHLGSDG